MSDESDDMERVKNACENLGEHFDTIQIFVTRFDSEEGTTNIAYGSGDYFSRYGKVKQWTIKEEARMRLEVQPENEE